MQQLICYQCYSTNSYITGENLATCRSCGKSYPFTYDKCLTTEQIITSLKVATNNNSQYLKELARAFFFYDDKPAWQKHSIYYNMLIFLEYGQSFRPNQLPVITLPEPKLQAMLEGKIRMHTRQAPTNYRGIVLLHNERSKHIEAAALLEYCSAIMGSMITSYKEEVAKGLRINAPTEGAELEYSDFTPRRYAYQLRDFKTLLEPLNYPDAVNGFSPFTLDQKLIKINWK